MRSHSEQWLLLAQDTQDKVLHATHKEGGMIPATAEKYVIKPSVVQIARHAQQ